MSGHFFMKISIFFIYWLCPWTLVTASVALGLEARGAELTCEILVAGDQAAQLFNAAFSDRDVYRPRMCGPNVRRLIRYFLDRDFDTRSGNVLFLRHEMRASGGVPVAMPSELVPARPRQPGASWKNYHAILDFKGMIFDLDFSPKPTPIALYFQNNFPEEANQRQARVDRIFLQVIPAEEFFAMSDEGRDFSRFPLMTVRQYLNSIAKSSP